MAAWRGGGGGADGRCCSQPAGITQLLLNMHQLNKWMLLYWHKGGTHTSLGSASVFLSLQLYSTFAVDEMLAMKSRWTARKQNERRKITSTQTSIDDGDWTKWWISTVKQIAKTYTELKENKNSILLKLFKETKVFHRKTSVCLLFYVQLNLFVFDLVKVDKWTCSHNKTAKYLLWWARFENFSCNILFFNVFHWW